MRTLDIDECAEFLKVDKSTALKLAGEGALPGARIGRAWVFLEDELVEYLRAETRRQARERQAKATVEQELDSAMASNAPLVMSLPKRGREKKARPDLSGYDLPQTKLPQATAL